MRLVVGTERRQLVWLQPKVTWVVGGWWRGSSGGRQSDEGAREQGQLVRPTSAPAAVTMGEGDGKLGDHVRSPRWRTIRDV